jgi:hypothetical protein
VATEEPHSHGAKSWQFNLNAIASQRSDCSMRCNGEWRVHHRRSALDHAQRFAPISCARDRAISTHDDRRLLTSDLFDGFAEILLMVKANVSDNRNATIPCVHRIESPAEPNLYNGAIDASGLKAVKNNAGEEFKFGDGTDARLNPVGGIKCPLHCHSEWEWGERAAINADSLAV